MIDDHWRTLGREHDAIGRQHREDRRRGAARRARGQLPNQPRGKRRVEPRPSRVAEHLGQAPAGRVGRHQRQHAAAIEMIDSSYGRKERMTKELLALDPRT